MKGRQIATGTYRGREVALLIQDGQTDDVLVDAPAGAPRVGAVFAALAERPAPKLGGQFVRLPGGAQGFVRGGDRPAGEVVMCQVSGVAEPGKAMPLRRSVELKGRLSIVTPFAPGLNISRKITDKAARAALRAAVEGQGVLPGGAIIRSQAAEAPIEEVAEEVQGLSRSAEAMLKAAGQGPALLFAGPSPAQQALTDWPAAPQVAFADVEGEALLEAFEGARVAYGQGSASFEPTRAFLAVDVNTGADFSPAAALKVNLAVAQDLPRQLRCRGLGGQVVLDFAPANAKDRARTVQVLEHALAADAVPTRVVGWTGLGHLELTRHRRRWPLIWA